MDDKQHLDWNNFNKFLYKIQLWEVVMVNIKIIRHFSNNHLLVKKNTKKPAQLNIFSCHLAACNKCRIGASIVNLNPPVKEV